jgi:hypothetical protein
MLAAVVDVASVPSAPPVLPSSKGEMKHRVCEIRICWLYYAIASTSRHSAHVVVASVAAAESKPAIVKQTPEEKNRSINAVFAFFIPPASLTILYPSSVYASAEELRSPALRATDASVLENPDVFVLGGENKLCCFCSTKIFTDISPLCSGMNRAQLNSSTQIISVLPPQIDSERR